jgi:catalase
MKPEEKDRLIANIAGNLGKVSRDDIIARAIGHFRLADADYGARLEAAIKAFRANPLRPTGTSPV